MKNWTIALALVAATGCPPMDDDGKPSQDTEPRVDETGVEDTDTAADTDTDTDTDTAADTDTAMDTDTDTAIDTAVEAACDPSDLEFRVEVRNDDGTLTDTFAPTDMPMLAGVLENTCEEGPVSIETTSTCLVELWTITGPDDVATEVRPVCSPTTTQWSIAGGTTEEATYKMESLVEGDYEIEVRFTYGGETATGGFTVETPEAEPPERP